MNALETIVKMATAATGKAANSGKIRLEGVGFATSTSTGLVPSRGPRAVHTALGATPNPLESRFVFSSTTPTPEVPSVEGVRAADYLLAAPGSAEHEARIQELQALTNEPNWDDETGVPVRVEQWEAARLILGFVLRSAPGAPKAFISACGDGTVHITWTNEDGDRGVLEIAVTKLWWSFLPANGAEDEFEAMNSPDELVEAKLTRLQK